MTPLRDAHLRGADFSAMEDAVDPDMFFQTSMGDDVEPRRMFIEEKARFVRKLGSRNGGVRDARRMLGTTRPLDA